MEQILEVALKELEKRTPLNFIDIANIKHKIAIAYNGQGKYEEALKYYNEAMEIYKKSLPPNDPNIAYTLHNIGNAYNYQGKYEEALYNSIQALEIFKLVFPLNHPIIANICITISRIYEKKAQVDKSSEIIRKFLQEKDYQQKLQTCWTACLVVNEDDPKGELESKYSKLNHGIEKMVTSQRLDLESLRDSKDQIILTRHIVCQCECSVQNANKRLVIAVTTTDPPSNHKSFDARFYDSIRNHNDYPTSNINEIVKFHGSRIPLQYFIRKLNDNYELVFTGYKFGAALAAFLTIQILIYKKLEKSLLERVSFIGFECPLFTSEEFKNVIQNENYTNKFHFYKNDYFIRDSFVDSFYNDIREKMRELYKQFGLNYNIRYGDNQENLNKISKRQSIESSEIKLENYLTNILEIENRTEQTQQNPINLIDDIKIERFQSWKTFSYQNYHVKLKETNCESFFTVFLVYLVNEVHIFFKICKSSPNFDTFFKAFLCIQEHKLSPIKSEFDNFSLLLQFRSPIRKFKVDEIKKISLKIIGFYNKIKLKPFAEFPLDQIHSLKEAENEDEKKIFIYQSSVDFLYINAFIFIYLLKNLKNLNNYTKDMNELVELFTRLETTLKGQPVFDFVRDSEEINKKVKDFLKEKQTNNENTKNMTSDTDTNNQKNDEKNEFAKIMYKRYKLEAPDKKKWHERVSTNTIESSINKLESNKNEKNRMKTFFQNVLLNIYHLKLAQIRTKEDLQLNPNEIIKCFYKYDEIISKEIFSDFYFEKALWHFKVDVLADLTYEMAVRNMIEKYGNVLPFVGFAEEKAAKEIKEKQEPIFELAIESNHRIREILVKNRLIGVIGLKKAGKSSFIDLICQTNVSDSIDETKEMAAYPVINGDSLLLIDYPHFNSTDKFYQLQFKHSKYMLDYVFLVCDVMQFGDTSTNDLFDLLFDLKSLGVKRFCMVANKFDTLLRKIKKKEEIDSYVNGKKELFVDFLVKIDEERQQLPDRGEYLNNLTVIPTCMNIDDFWKRADKEDIIGSGILYGEDLRKKIFELIKEHIRLEENVKEQLDSHVKSKRVNTFNKKCKFIYINQKGIERSLELPLIKVNSWDELIETLKDEEGLNIKKDFTIKTRKGNAVISTFEDLKNCENEEFEIHVIN